MHIIVPDNLDRVGLDILSATDGVTYVAPEKMNRQDLLAVAAEADGLIIRSATKVDAEMFEALTKVRAIARAGVGVDNVDLEIATQRGVIVMNAPDGNTVATAELSIAMMLSLVRQIPQAHASMKEGKWDRKTFMGSELRGKTLGILGFGRVGRAVAKRALAFDMNVIAYDPFVVAENIQIQGVTLLDLDDVLERSDILTLHAVTTPETRQIIRQENIAKMKYGVRIINVARGSLINDADLADALNSGKVAGAALDVFEPEPPKADNPLLSAPNLIHTPHLGASTLEAQNEVAIQATNSLLKALLTGEYENVVNPAVLG
jgi:D-3-phosphoglycerate dehydrogenase / 2-oxoglutarate reductase